MATTSSRICVWALAMVLLGSIAVHASSSVATISTRRLLQAPDGEIFPPNCACDRNSSNSPYRLALTNVSSVPGFNVYCYKIVNAGCDSTSPCCEGNTGVMKVEFEVVNGCKTSLKRVTVNDVVDSFEYNSNMGTLRITGLNLTDEDADDTKICLFLDAKANCSTLNQLCYPPGYSGCKYAIFNLNKDCCPVAVVDFWKPPPPPSFVPIVPAFSQPPPPSPAPALPPPPPPPIFPNCSCDREPLNSQVALSPVVKVSNESNGWTKMCFTIDTRPSCLVPNSSCCTFQLYKLEFAVNVSCSRCFMNATVNGVRATRSFQTRPYPALKVTSLAVPFDSVDGLEACIFMRAPCNTLATLGSNPDGSISAGLFNAPGPGANCCPIYTVTQ